MWLNLYVMTGFTVSYFTKYAQVPNFDKINKTYKEAFHFIENNAFENNWGGSVMEIFML